MEAFVVTCAPITCAAPTHTSVPAGALAAADTVWTAAAQQVVAFQPGRLRIGEQTLPLDGAEISPRSGAVAVTGARVHVTAAEATGPPGLHVTLGGGDEPGYWRQVLWSCEQTRCRRQVLDGFARVVDREMMAAAADGRVLIVRSDRILLVSGTN
jgi:hypothetical protein